MTLKKAHGLVKMVYLLTSAAFVLFLALDSALWTNMATNGYDNGYDRAIFMLFAFLMGTLVGGIMERD